MTSSNQSARNGAPIRDSNGRFLPGHPGGPGRPRGHDLKQLVEIESLIEGFDVKAALYRVIRKLFDLAEKGDTAAAKILMDKLTAPDTELVVIANQAAEPPVGPPIPPPRERAIQLLEVHRLVTELAGPEEAQVLIAASEERRSRDPDEMPEPVPRPAGYQIPIRQG